MKTQKDLSRSALLCKHTIGASIKIGLSFYFLSRFISSDPDVLETNISTFLTLIYRSTGIDRVYHKRLYLDYLNIF